MKHCDKLTQKEICTDHIKKLATNARVIYPYTPMDYSPERIKVDSSGIIKEVSVG